jgi:quercetin dioxygenase-like cupin family protein
MSQKVFDKAKTYALAESITYADGAIVSKIISKNDAGNLTLFAFDKEQNLSEHTAPFDAIIQVVEGKAEVHIDGKPYEVNAGEFIIMPANIPHAVDAIEKFKMLLIMLKAKESPRTYKMA